MCSRSRAAGLLSDVCLRDEEVQHVIVSWFSPHLIPRGAGRRLVVGGAPLPGLKCKGRGVLVRRHPSALVWVQGALKVIPVFDTHPVATAEQPTKAPSTQTLCFLFTRDVYTRTEAKALVWTDVGVDVASVKPSTDSFHSGPITRPLRSKNICSDWLQENHTIIIIFNWWQKGIKCRICWTGEVLTLLCHLLVMPYFQQRKLVVLSLYVCGWIQVMI